MARNRDGTRLRWITVGLLVVASQLIDIGQAQAVTRDPRFYSREGDYNFKWPNPGDPDYR